MNDAGIGRRDAMLAMGLGLAAGLADSGAAHADAAHPMALPKGSKTLAELAERLAKAPRRRDYKTVPMIVTDKNYWDHEALTEVIHYDGGPKQCWDNTDIVGPWLNLMRNSANVQIYAFKHANFLAISATHGPCSLALLDQEMWDKYSFSKLLKGKVAKNTFILKKPGASVSAEDYENPEGFYSSHNLSIPALQERGMVFLGCHNAMWEIAEKLIKAGFNPDKLSHEALTADLTNHFIPGVVVTPGIVGTIPELIAAGYSYAR